MSRRNKRKKLSILKILKMNIKITKEQHERLSKVPYTEYLFGSQLHGIATEDSDKDFIRIYDFKDVFDYNGVGKYFPATHSFQYDDAENNCQYVWMTVKQFYSNLFSGDGNMNADIVLLSGQFYKPLEICRSYRVIKGYLGVAKRDLKLHGNSEKKRFHAFRSLMMAEKLIENQLPTVKDIKDLKKVELPSRQELFEKETMLRAKLNIMLEKEEIFHYPILPIEDDLLSLLLNSNNIKEFKYD